MQNDSHNITANMTANSPVGGDDASVVVEGNVPTVQEAGRGQPSKATRRAQALRANLRRRKRPSDDSGADA